MGLGHIPRPDDRPGQITMYSDPMAGGSCHGIPPAAGLTGRIELPRCSWRILNTQYYESLADHFVNKQITAILRLVNSNSLNGIPTRKLASQSTTITERHAHCWHGYRGSAS